MTQPSSTRLLIRTALLIASSTAGLMAQNEMASNSLPHASIPFTNLPSQPEMGSITDLQSVASGTPIGIPAANHTATAQPLLMPGTLAKDSTPALKPGQKSAFSVEPDYLPSWVTNQPLAYLRYGAAPAVVTLHFGHN